MNLRRLVAGLAVVIAPILCGQPGSADELDAGFSEPTPPTFSAPPVPDGVYLVTDVYAGEVVATSGNTTTYATATVADVPGTYARVVDVVRSGDVSAFDDRSFNGRGRLTDGRSIAGTYYEDFVLTSAGFVSVNIVFFQDDSETREPPRSSAAPSRAPNSSPAPTSSPVARVLPSAAPSSIVSPAPRLPAATAAPRTPVVTAGVALAPDGPVLGSMDILRGRTVVLWPRAFADGIAMPIRSWRLVSGSADLVTPLSGSAADGCAVSWRSLAPGGVPFVLRFEVTSDALAGRAVIATISVIVRSPALLQ